MFIWQSIMVFFLIEAFTLFSIIGKIGFLKTLGLWILSAAFGVFLIQRQGAATMAKMQNLLNRGGVPVEDAFDAFCLFIAGLLLLLPGFISDGLAFLLLIPQVRKALSGKIPASYSARTNTPGPMGEDVIDGTYVRVEETVEVIEQKPANDQNPPL